MTAPVPAGVPRHSRRAPRHMAPSYRHQLARWCAAYAAMIVLAAGYAWTVAHV